MAPVTVPAPPAYQKQGFYYSQALDSELYRCQWHRIILRGEIPPGTRVEVSTYTAEALLPDDQVQNLPEEAWETRQIANEMPGGEWDCLVRSGGGRYLWLRLEFKGNGKVTPILDSIVIEFPRISLRRYLPAVFGMEPVSADFTDRFLEPLRYEPAQHRENDRHPGALFRPALDTRRAGSEDRRGFSLLAGVVDRFVPRPALA